MPSAEKETGTSLVNACPLCGSRSSSLRERIPYAAIWEAFEEQHGAVFPEAVMRRHAPAADARLHECNRCGLQYFAPAVPGDSEFYEQLMRSSDYETDRWEFDAVAARTRAVESLVDFGCGHGAFLRGIAGSVRRAVGVDHNVEALGRLGAVGIETHAEDFERFAEREREHFDAACAFQLMEHLPRIEGLLAPMVGCVKPGGRVFISVPNRERYGTGGVEPMDCPPHHVSRWAPRQLEQLSERFALELCAITYEPLAYASAVELVLSPLDHVLPVSRRGITRIVSGGCRRLIIGPRRYRFAVRRQLFRRAGYDGHALLAEFRRPRS